MNLEELDDGRYLLAWAILTFLVGSRSKPVRSRSRYSGGGLRGRSTEAGAGDGYAGSTRQRHRQNRYLDPYPICMALHVHQLVSEISHNQTSNTHTSSHSCHVIRFS